MSCNPFSLTNVSLRRFWAALVSEPLSHFPDTSLYLSSSVRQSLLTHSNSPFFDGPSCLSALIAFSLLPPCSFNPCRGISQASNLVHENMNVLVPTSHVFCGNMQLLSMLIDIPFYPAKFQNLTAPSDCLAFPPWHLFIDVCGICMLP